MVTLHNVNTVYDVMLDHQDGVMRALAKKETQWKDDIYFAVKFARQKLSKYSADVTAWTSILLISAHILDPVQEFRLLRN